MLSPELDAQSNFLKMSEESQKELMDKRVEETKKLFARVIKTETNVGNLCSIFDSYSRKIATLRDKTDEIAKCVSDVSKSEDFNTSTKITLTLVAELIAMMADHQNLEVERLQSTMISGLSSYESIFKAMKQELQGALTAQQKQVIRKKDLDRITLKAEGDNKWFNGFAFTTKDYDKAVTEAARRTLSAQERMLEFEHNRMQDLKKCLQDFFRSEIAMHAKALEICTEAYTHVHNIDVNNDLEIVMDGLQLRDPLFPSNDTKPSKKSGRNKGSHHNDMDPMDRHYASGDSQEEESRSHHRRKSHDKIKHKDEERIQRQFSNEDQFIEEEKLERKKKRKRRNKQREENNDEAEGFARAYQLAKYKSQSQRPTQAITPKYRPAMITPSASEHEDDAVTRHRRQRVDNSRYRERISGESLSLGEIVSNTQHKVHKSTSNGRGNKTVKFINRN